MNIDQIKKKSVSASKWSFLAKLLPRIISPISYIILAFLLVPDDFGIVAISTLVVSFSELFWDFGLNLSLIQRLENKGKSADVVFWTNLILSIVVFMLILVSASLISGFFNDTRIEVVIQLQSFQILFNSLATVPITLFKRELEFKPIFISDIIMSIVQFGIAIPLAIIGFSYWSLIYGILLASFIRLIFIWTYSDWVPSFSFNMEVAKEMYSFGLWVSIDQVLGWLIKSLDIIILGRFLELDVVGIYEFGKRITYTVFDGVFEGLKPVWFSTFSRLQRDMMEFKKSFKLILKLNIFIILPMVVGIFLISDYLENLVFGSNWFGIGLVIKWIAVSRGISQIRQLNPSTLRAIGKPEVQTMFATILSSIKFLGYLFTVKSGLFFFIGSEIVVNIIFLPLHFHLVKKYLGVSLSIIIKESKFILIGTISMALSLYLIKVSLLTSYNFLNLILLILLGFVLYFILLVPEINFIKKIVKTIT